MISLVIHGGTVYDGNGGPGVAGDVLVDGDRVATVGPRPDGLDADIIDATGLAVAPGFVNVLSHAWDSLQLDPSGASDLLQGVTTEVFGEALSLGPGGPDLAEYVGTWDLRGAEVDFPRLSDGLAYLERRGVAPNVASFVGAHNLRILGAGFQDGPMEAAALDRMCCLLDEEMAEGALGIGTALIYPPGSHAGTAELVALSEVVSRHGGMYISHVRNESSGLLSAVEEVIEISRRASVRAEVYHLKSAGRENWPMMTQAIERIHTVRSAGEPVTADMYPYTAGSTALAAAIPPEYQIGGPRQLMSRLGDPRERQRMAAAIRAGSADWENLYRASGGGTGVLLLADLADGTPARGRQLSEVAADLDLDEVDALLEIVARDPSISAAYFLMDESNVRLGLRQPWVSIGSDARAHRAEAPWTDEAAHPRTYGTFARVLGHYCRDVGLFSLGEAVRRMTSLPADNLCLPGRGRLEPGSAADVVVFDPAAVGDHATYAEPHRYATGIHHVLVNGIPVVRGGLLTGQHPGRRLRRGGG
ncbi:MAG: N-acyl-D-amino acid deacylase [Pseudonocardiales bacterium]|nr:MAG: N-acyl-D-amino acid deacylase [Pseudonocardiales bacterium]